MAGGYGKGLDFLRGQNKALGGGGGSGFKKLWLWGGDAARIYFLTDLADAPVPLIHLVAVPPRGERRGYTKDVLCSKKYAEDETPCPLCAQQSADVQGPYPRLFQYVYVTSIFHKEQRDDTWIPRASASGDTIYEEVCGDVRLLISKFQLQDQIQSAYVGDPEAADYGKRQMTLQDSQYQISVAKRGDPEKLVRVGPPIAGLPAVVQEALAKVPPIEESLVSELGRGNVTVVAGAPAAAGRPAAPTMGQPAYEDGDTDPIDF